MGIKEDFKKGDFVILVTKPEGNQSRNEPVRVGEIYEVLGRDGNDLITTSDTQYPACIWIGRFQKTNKPTGP